MTFAQHRGCTWSRRCPPGSVRSTYHTRPQSRWPRLINEAQEEAGEVGPESQEGEWGCANSPASTTLPRTAESRLGPELPACSLGFEGRRRPLVPDPKKVSLRELGWGPPWLCGLRLSRDRGGPGLALCPLWGVSSLCFNECVPSGCWMFRSQCE